MSWIKQSLVIVASVAAGVILMGGFVLSFEGNRGTMELLAVQHLIGMGMAVFFVAVSLWIILDLRDHSDIDLEEVFAYDVDKDDD